MTNISSHILVFAFVLSSNQSRLQTTFLSSGATWLKKSLWTSFILGIVNFDFDLVEFIVIIYSWWYLLYCDWLFARHKPDVYAIRSHRNIKISYKPNWSSYAPSPMINYLSLIFGPNFCIHLSNNVKQVWDLMFLWQL